MKNKFIIILIALFFESVVYADNISIQAKNVTIDKKKNLTIFNNQVLITTVENDTIKSDYAEYDNLKGIIKLKKNVIIVDNQKNTIETENAEYYENEKILKSIGPTKITTLEKYVVKSNNIILDNNKNYIKSEFKTTVTDIENNEIFLDNFEYQKINNIFKSIGFIKVTDKSQNSYEFSQLYIDTKKKEMLGTDIKAYMNSDDFKIHKDNKPRIFANNTNINNNASTFNKSIFTLCNYRKNDKCPPWSIQSKKMLHNKKKKTIYYDNAVIKVYDIPIFYLPKLSHPDPTVKRRSGFLPPLFSDAKNLGPGITIPYFFALNEDKNLTFTNKLYFTENPLFLGEYHQAFKNSNFLADFGYTAGYKNTSIKKKSGDKNHFFSKISKTFSKENNSESSLNFSIQKVSHDKYLKLYKIKSNLVDYNTNTLENTLSFTHDNEEMFLGVNANIYETLNDSYEDKYEYVFPELIFDKNIVSSELYGDLNFQANYKVHKYDTNKFTNFLINDFDWNYKEINHKSGLKSKFLANFKNINYETKNVDLYKEDTTSEIYTAFGYLADLRLEKNNGIIKHLFKPKMLLRYAPGSMRKETTGTRLDPANAFSIDRLDNINNFETGLTGTLGFDYSTKKENKIFDFSLAQIINEKENKKMASKSSLDEKLSDLVGTSEYRLNENISLKYNFSVDQNYNDLNYNEIGTRFEFDSFKVNFDYLEENKHIGDQQYIKTKIDFNRSENSLISFENKRNLVKDSSEFYNLSYEYLNDCLRAGLVYRREFYDDSELEPENSLMFKITLTPFGNISSPSFSQ